jgi:hypothetical protein
MTTDEYYYNEYEFYKIYHLIENSCTIDHPNKNVEKLKII